MAVNNIRNFSARELIVSLKTIESLTIENYRSLIEKAEALNTPRSNKNAKPGTVTMQRSMLTDKLGWETSKGIWERTEFINVDSTSLENLLEIPEEIPVENRTAELYDLYRDANIELTDALWGVVCRCGISYEGREYMYFCSTAGKAKNGQAYFVDKDVVGFGPGYVTPIFTAEEIEAAGITKELAARINTTCNSLMLTSAVPSSEVGMKQTLRDIRMLSEENMVSTAHYEQATLLIPDHKGHIETKDVENIDAPFSIYDGTLWKNAKFFPEQRDDQVRPLKGLSINVDFEALEELFGVEMTHELKDVDGETFDPHNTPIIANESTCKLMKISSKLDPAHPWKKMVECFERAGWSELYIHC